MKGLFVDRYGEVRDWVVGAVIVLSVAAGLTALIAAIAVPILWLDNTSCHRQGDAMQREVRWGAIEGCLIETTDGRFVPLDTYRLTEEEQ